MGLKVRKSKNLGGGIKLNFNKKSVGMSFGTKGARVSINSNGRITRSASIPGTGIYSSKTTSIKSNSPSDHSTNQYSPKAITHKRINEYSNKTLILLSYIWIFFGIICLLLLALPLLFSHYFVGGIAFVLIAIFSFTLSGKYRKIVKSKAKMSENFLNI